MNNRPVFTQLIDRKVPPNSVAASPAGSSQSNYIRGFDGFRAIAVGLVLLAHGGYGDLVPGGFGVTIFFVISGFLITRLLLNEINSNGAIQLKNFYVRRLLRLYPELLVLVTICLIVGKYTGYSATTVEKLASVLYFMNYYNIFGIQYVNSAGFPWHHLWSLAVEEHFYVFFPLFLMILPNSWYVQVKLMVVLIIVPATWRCFAYLVLGLSSDYSYVATDTRLDSIAWGCLLALLLYRNGSGKTSVKQTWISGARALVIGLLLLAASFIVREESFRWTVRFSLQGLGIAIIIANILFNPRWKSVVDVLELSPIRYIGKISYGLYLYHVLINQLIVSAYPGISKPIFLVSSLFFSLLTASLSYFFLAVPFQSLRRRLGSHVR